MNNLEALIECYLDICQYEKKLSQDTLKAYRTDGGGFRGRRLGRKKALSSPSTGRKRLLSWCHPCSERNSAPSVLLLREGDHTRLRARW